jgi:hypothetical protein
VIVPEMQKKVKKKVIDPAMQKRRKLLKSCCDSNYLEGQRERQKSDAVTDLALLENPFKQLQCLYSAPHRVTLSFTAR